MIQNIIIVAIIMLVITLIGYGVSRYLNNEDQTTEDPKTQYTPEELDNIKLAEELYNKDLRPVVAKKAKPQVAEELNVVEPEFIPKENKPEFPVDKSKKKKKYYPKTKK
jgi:hypothetical protein